MMKELRLKPTVPASLGSDLNLDSEGQGVFRVSWMEQRNRIWERDWMIDARCSECDWEDSTSSWTWNLEGKILVRVKNVRANQPDSIYIYI
jgi:hypothetical protein